MNENKPNINNQGELKNIRTYMTDMADSVRANEISVLKVALAEQNKHEREDLYRKVEGTPTKKVFWFIGGIVFIACAIYGYQFLTKKIAQNNEVVKFVKIESIIPYDEISTLEVSISGSLVENIKKIKNELAATKDNSIKFISITEEINGLKEIAPVSDLFSNLGFTSAPSSLVRSLSDSYMIGTYTKTVGEAASLFIILQPKDYEYAYAGMLEWEKGMAGDMFGLFSLDSSESIVQLNSRKFKDIIINNKDTRVLLNESNKEILYYMFIDKNNMIITDSKDTIKEVIARLITKNIKPL